MSTKTLQTIVHIDEDGKLTAVAPDEVPRGDYRVLIVFEDETGPCRPFPDMSKFRDDLGAPMYPGNTVIELREEERS